MPNPSDNLIGWYAGESDEYYTEGPFPSRQDAIEAGRAEFDGGGFWVCKAQKQEVRFCAKTLIEDQYHENDDLFDYENSNGPERKGEHEAADVELQTLLDQWTTRWKDTFAQPTLFYQSFSDEYIEGTGEEEED